MPFAPASSVPERLTALPLLFPVPRKSGYVNPQWRPGSNSRTKSVKSPWGRKKTFPFGRFKIKQIVGEFPLRHFIVKKKARKVGFTFMSVTNELDKEEEMKISCDG